MTLVGNSYLVAGTSESLPELLEVLRKNGIETEGNPDVYVRTHQHFGVDEARDVRDRAQGKAVAGNRRVFIVIAPGMTNEAQNALLKTIEEPPGDAFFFFVIPSPLALLSTVRSRTQILSLEEETKKGLIDEKKFLSSTPQARLEMLKVLLEKGEDDKRNIGEILTFLSLLERRLGRMKKGSGDGLRAIYSARKYMGDKGALVKPLLESVALLTPVL